MSPELLTAAAKAGPWAVIAVVTLLILLVVVRGLVRALRDWGQRRMVTDGAQALRGGGVLVKRNGIDSLFLALPSSEVPPATPTTQGRSRAAVPTAT